MVLNLYWPAVSQICNLTLAPSSGRDLVLKSIPVLLLGYRWWRDVRFGRSFHRSGGGGWSCRLRCCRWWAIWLGSHTLSIFSYYKQWHTDSIGSIWRKEGSLWLDVEIRWVILPLRSIFCRKGSTAIYRKWSTLPLQWCPSIYWLPLLHRMISRHAPLTSAACIRWKSWTCGSPPKTSSFSCAPYRGGMQRCLKWPWWRSWP